MKKGIATMFAFFMASTISFAQKGELKTAEKAIKSGNFASAKSAITAAESLIASSDAKTKAKFYFLKGKALYADGAGSDADIDMAFESFDKLITLEKSGKKNYTNDVNEMKSGMINNFLTKANADLEKKNHAASSKGFERAYRLSPQDTQEEEVFPNKAMRDISVKAGTHIKPGVKRTEPRSAEIIKNIALIYISKGENDKAVTAIEKARAMNPDDLNLILSEANVRYKMGDVASYKSLISKAIEMDPNNPELLYNLGVTSAESDPEAAKGYYKKAIELDPEYVNAQINMAALILAEENAIVEEMNGLGSSKADDMKYDNLKAKRMQVYKDAIPYLLSALKIKPNNIDAAKTLMNIYSAVGDTAKYKEIKAKVDALQSGGN